MSRRIVHGCAALMVLALVAIVLFWFARTGAAQEDHEDFIAKAIPLEGQPSSLIRIRITSYTTPAEQADLLKAFNTSPGEGMALLGSMTKGYISIEGRPGRRIHAVFTRLRADGRELILISNQVLSPQEEREGVSPREYPFAVCHMRFDTAGTPLGGEVFSAVKLAIAPDDLLDVATDHAKRIAMEDLQRE